MFLGVLHEIEPPESGNYNKAPKKAKYFLDIPETFCVFLPINPKKLIAFLHRIN